MHNIVKKSILDQVFSYQSVSNSIAEDFSVTCTNWTSLFVVFSVNLAVGSVR